MSAPNARFWTDHNGPAKLTLKAGGPPIGWESRGPTEEGWSASGERYWLEGGFVFREWFSDGADCDGRSSSSGLSRCHRSRLAARWVGRCAECKNTIAHTFGADLRFYPCGLCGWGPIDWLEQYPDWEPIESGQRDYAAEAAGY